MRWVLVAALLLAGCTFQQVRERTVERFTQPPPLPERPDDACLSAQYRRYVGGPPEALGDLVFAQPMRILFEGDALDRSYDPARLNFEIDAAGTISRIFCG